MTDKSTKPQVKKCVLAYSGGLDTSIIVPWLKNNYKCEVICFCANLGQDEELAGLEEKALASGASKCYVEDLRMEFLTDYVFPTMQAGALYERDYLLGTSFAAAVDRQETGGDRRAGGCRRRRPWRNRQRQRPGAL